MFRLRALTVPEESFCPTARMHWPTARLDVDDRRVLTIRADGGTVSDWVPPAVRVTATDIPLTVATSPRTKAKLAGGLAPFPRNPPPGDRPGFGLAPFRAAGAQVPFALGLSWTLAAVTE